VAAGDDADDESKPAESGSFELSLAELEAIVHDLEEGQLGLAESLARYEQGVKHLRQCFDLLEQAERKIDLLTGVAEDGSTQTTPFAAEDASPPDSTPRRRK
jgi:exodeoxyribonuclease VII small subunit